MAGGGVVYAIVNTVNGKMYVGSTVDFEKRKAVHLRQLIEGKHHSKHLQRAYDKYGESAFEFQVLEYVDNQERLLEREQAHIDRWESFRRSKGYNVSAKATHCVLYGEEHWSHGLSRDEHPLFGRKHPEDVKRKIGDAQRGERNHNYRRPAWNRGKPMSEETKRKLRAALKGKPGYWKGKSLPPEVREKMSRAAMGRPVSEKVICKPPEWRRNISEGKKGKFLGGDNPNARSVIQMSITMEPIRRFESLADASRETGVHINGIVGCCRGRRKTAGGFKWRYADDNN